MSILAALPDDQYIPTAFARFSAADRSILDVARAMMWLSQLAYESDDLEKIEKIGGRWSLAAINSFRQPAITVLPMSITRGLVAKKDAVTIICFTGSDPLVLPDWVTDFTIRITAEHLHEGFQDAVAAVWDDLAPVFDSAKASGSPLMFAGHSLGGALAVVAAERALREQKIQTADIYTFGAPRVGSAAFASQYGALADTTYRFIHGEDIVPTVPPVEFGFQHVGHHLHCPSGGQFVVDGDLGGVGEDAAAPSNGLPGVVLDEVRRLISPPASPSFRSDALGKLFGLLPPGIGDHVPDRYLHALGN
jgi:triacylglycerol lipase